MFRLFFITTFLVSSVYQQIFPIITTSQNEKIKEMQEKLNEDLMYGDNQLIRRFNVFKKRLKNNRVLCLELLNFRENNGRTFLDGVRWRGYLKAYREIRLYQIENETERETFLSGYLDEIEGYINSLSTKTPEDTCVKRFLEGKFSRYKKELEEYNNRERAINNYVAQFRHEQEERDRQEIEQATVVVGIDGQEMTLERAIELFGQANLFE